MPGAGYDSSSTPLLPMSAYDRIQPAFWNSLLDTHIEQDDVVWKEYVEAANAFDTRMINEWNKILDVVLVFIALFIAVLTSFVIETAKQFVRDPADITNEILVVLVNKLSNSSSVSEIHISDFTQLVPANDDSQAIISNTLLFVSLAISIVIAMTAVAAKLWLVQYTSRVGLPGSPHERALRRQEAYSGVKAWKMHWVIDSLPLLTLAVVFLFGLFIYHSTHDYHVGLGFIVATTFLIGLTFFLIASFSAAFISSSPFQSPFSRFVALCFDKILAGTGKWYSATVLTSSVAVDIVTTLLVAFNSPAYQPLILLPIAGVFAVIKKPKKSNKHSSLFGQPLLVLVGGIIIFVLMTVASSFNSHPAIFISLSFMSLAFLSLYGYFMNQRTQFVPDISTQEARAIAWLLETSTSPDTSLLKKAGCIANTAHGKALLLKTLLPLLPPLVSSCLRHPCDGERHEELQVFLSCLAHLSDFPDSKRSLRLNKAAVEHPALPLVLLVQLERLGRSGDQRHRDAASAVWHHLSQVERWGNADMV